MNIDTYLALETIRSGTIDLIRSSALDNQQRLDLAVDFEQFYAEYLHRIFNAPPPVVNA